MSVTLVIGKRHALAGLFLFVLGCLIGGALIAPANSQAVTTYTRSASCAGLSFYPASSNLRYSNVGSLQTALDNTGGSGPATFRCDPGLPNGASVTKVDFTLASNFPSAPVVEGCNLSRVALAATGKGAYQVMASVPSSPLNTPIVRESTTSISYPTVNDSSYAYWLECTIFEPASTVGIYGADVVYTITAAKG